ncbi:type II toxin-antitoxin system Phd/YefM family antitoxin [Promicromonospora panici]|uniref:type II toxin-antitoxin system Phd/YefM family antitoxin n=1 Tax=Promicromonospora panici TaxID=2219658 RepID=UPI00101DA6E6|nr:type II toxin-antitoxin system Phd/YefM family antitoxin [Promicromonospora panici]
MRTIGARELKQNPHAVIQHVLETGEEYEITSYGRPAGVRIVPDNRSPRRWVLGNDLADVPPMSPRNAAAWRADVEGAMDDEVSGP